MKYLITLLLLVSSMSLTAQDEQLLGTWLSSEGNMIFDSDGFVTIEYETATIGGKEFDMNGIKASMVYKTDYSTNPYSITMTIKMGQDEVLGTLYGFFEFVDDKTLRMAAGELDQKITAMTAANTIVFKRKE